MSYNLVVFLLAVSGPVHAARCERIKPMKYCSLARLTLSPSLCIRSSGSIFRSLTECPGIQKCSATPDLSVFLLMICIGNYI